MLLMGSRVKMFENIVGNNLEVSNSFLRNGVAEGELYWTYVVYGEWDKCLGD